MSKYVNKEDVYGPLQAIRAGRTGKPVQYTKGGEYAYGTITFADNPTATDTITLNGVVIEFSAGASDFGTAGTVADPYILNIKASLTLTLDELATQTNGSANASLSVATYTNVDGSVFSIAYDTIGTAGNAYTLAASADTVSGAVLTGGEAVHAIDLGCENIDLALTDTRDQYFSLADAPEFTKKVIVLTAKGTGNAVISYNATTITLTTAGQFVVLQFLDGDWRVIADPESTALNGLTPADGAFIVGDGSTFVAETGATARTSLGFTDPILDKAAPGEIGGTTPAAITGTTVTGDALTVASGGTFVADNGTASATAGAATSNTMAGVITSEALTTAVDATYTLTLTNSLVTANSNILVTTGLGTATTGSPQVLSVTPGAGSVSIVIKNNDSTNALNGTILVQYMIVAP